MMLREETNNLAAAYRRRSMCAITGFTAAFVVAGMPSSLKAQDAPAPPAAVQANPAPPPATKKDAKPTDTKGVPPKPMDVGKPGTVRSIPVQRRRGGGQGRGQGNRLTPGMPPPGVFPGGQPGTTVVPMPGAPPAPGGKMSSGTPFSFDYRGTDIANVLKFFAMMSGKSITVDKDVSGPVTIICPTQVTLDEAFKILQSVLASRGFTALQDDKIISIVPFDRAIGSTTILNADVDPDVEKTKLDPTNQVMTQVIPLENVDAEAIAKELAPLISKGASLIGSAGTNALIMTDTASNVKRFLTLVNALDKTSNSSEMKVYSLKRADATGVAEIINNLYKQITTRGRGAGAGGGQPGQPPMPMPGPPGAGGAAGGGRAAVVAVADVRTNSVLVVASADTQTKIATTIINRLDDDDSNAIETEIRKIKYADATQVANLVNTTLSNLRPGGQQQQSQSFQQRTFGFFNPFGDNGQQQQNVSSSDPFGKVTADPRTNSLLITASADRMEKIKLLIDQLDVDVPVETTTFVFPLKNAQADDVAGSLSKAFGTTQQNQDPFGFFFGGGGGGSQTGGRRQRTNGRLGPRNNTVGGSSGSGGFGRSATRGVPPGPPNAPDNGDQGDVQGSQTGGGSAIPDGVQGVMTPEGFVATDGDSKERTRQFFGFGRRFGGPPSIGQNNGPQFGRGRSGSYSNLLQLQNNVFVTASPNGDAVIITTTPDNYKALQEIIEALDVIPRQVMIEVIVAEVTLDKNEKLGLSLGGKFANLFNRSNTGQGTLNFPLPGTNSPTFDALASGGNFVISGANYNALLQALTTDSKVKVLSTPRVFTSNNQEAEINITTRLPFINGQTSSGLNSLVTNQVEFQEVGFVLNVIPRITRQGLVTIDVEQIASDFVRFDTLGTGTSAVRAPVINNRSTNTLVTAQDGETVVLGGLIRDSKTLTIEKTPILSEIPIIGQFFRSRENATNRTELMIFMTPHVVNSIEEARDMARKEASNLLPKMPDLGKQYPILITPKNYKDRKANPAPGTPKTGENTDNKTDKGTTP